ncbi:MAG TPA: GlsB/YeaQ/YmgE family stress response membrane protein [Aggregatilineaceae bacterium]|nr:GlsB/YeaQ/YmgE family stress response membrane protein [Aggregatilineaceae bacterium]
MELGQIIALIIIGALAGTGAMSITGRNKKSGGWVTNTVIGVIGAVVGGYIFDALDINLPDILEASISLGNLLVAFVGALIVIWIVSLISKR